MKIQKLKFIEGHIIPYLYCTKHLKKKYITVLRNPVDRVFSYYHLSLNDKNQPYHYLATKSIFHFLKYCPEAQNIYCKYLSSDIEKDINSDLYELAQKNLKNFDTIIKFDNFENDVKKFIEKFNVANIEIPHINKSNNKRKISNEELKAIEFYNFYDIKLVNQFKA